MNTTKKIMFAAGFAASFAALEASATVLSYTDLSAFNTVVTTTHTDNFESVAPTSGWGGSVGSSYVTGAATITTPEDPGLYKYNGFFGLPTGALAAANSGPGNGIGIALGAGVTAIGLDVGDAFGSGNYEFVLTDAANSILATFTFAVGGDSWSFFGFTSDEAEIRNLNLRGVSGTTNYEGIDNLVLGTVPSAVPLPAALPLFLAALGGLGFAARRRKAA